MKYILYTDNRQNPHRISTREFDMWQDSEKRRLQELSDFRSGIKFLAQTYLTDKNPEVRSMAHFINNLLKD